MIGRGVWDAVRLAILLVTTAGAALASAGCSTVSLPAVLPAPAHGQDLDPGPAPDARACQALIRQDIGGAVDVRKELAIDGLTATEDAARAAAADPAAEVSPLGIPATAEELAAVRASGTATDGGFAVSVRANSTLTHRFGGVWIDPPGSGKMVVSVVGGDQAAADLVQCVQGGTTVRFVVSGTSLADGTARMDRVAADADALRAGGIDISMIDWDETRETLVVGVSSDIVLATRILRERYGQDTEVVTQQPVVPL